MNSVIHLIFLCFIFAYSITDMSDTERDLPPMPPTTVSNSTDCHQQALNYSTLAATAAAVAASNANTGGGDDQNISSTETLLRNIQSLLKVAADNARQQERQITYEKGNFYFLILGRFFFLL